MTMNLKVKKNEENPESAEVLAESIIKIADAFTMLLSSRLTDSAIITLLRGMPGMSSVSQGNIALVLNNLKRLKGYYLRKK